MKINTVVNAIASVIMATAVLFAAAHTTPVNADEPNNCTVTAIPEYRTAQGRFIAPDTVETYDGNTYSVNEGGLYPQSDICVTFDTKGTSDPSDDTIITITILDTEEVNS